MRRFGLVIATVLIGSLGWAEGASACSCVGPERVYRSADAAFKGRLLEKERAGRRETYSYRIVRVYKGAEQYGLVERDEISLPVSLIGQCGFPQKKGERYGVMAFEEEKGGGLQANGCTMTSAERLRKIARRAGDARASASDQASPGGNVSCGGVSA